MYTICILFHTNQITKIFSLEQFQVLVLTAAGSVNSHNYFGEELGIG